MRKLLSAVFLATALSACGGGAGNNSCGAPNLADPFISGNKVQVSRAAIQGAAGSNPVASAASAAVSRLQVGNSFSTFATAAETVPAGADLVAVVKEDCVADGHRTPSGMRTVPYKLPNAMSVSELETQAQQNACIVGISDNVKMKASSAWTDPMVSQQAHLNTIDQPAADDMFFGASGINKDVVVAIIDTGVDLDHQDLKDNIWTNPKEIPGNGVDDDHNGYIDDVNGWNFVDNNNNPRPANSGAEHGTHVAGLAAARGGNGIGVAGVMGQHVKIMALNVFGPNADANSNDIDNAIRYAADNGADVINMSLGGAGRPTSTEQAIQYALSKGVTIVVAAGNSGALIDTNSNFESPASFSGLYPGVIAVGSIDENTLNMSGFSDYGTDTVKIGSPGSDSVTGSGLLSTLPGNQYGRLQGTSMASPVAAGAAALAVGYVKSKGGTPSPAQIEDIMVTPAKVVSNLTNVFKGGKILNLKNMADYLASHPLTTVQRGAGFGGSGLCQ